MADREDNVYKAKLAEQAERYDGMLYFGLIRAFCCDTLRRFDAVSACPLAGPDLWQRCLVLLPRRVRGRLTPS